MMQNAHLCPLASPFRCETGMEGEKKKKEGTKKAERRQKEDGGRTIDEARAQALPTRELVFLSDLSFWGWFGRCALVKCNTSSCTNTDILAVLLHRTLDAPAWLGPVLSWPGHDSLGKSHWEERIGTIGTEETPTPKLEQETNTS